MRISVATRFTFVAVAGILTSGCATVIGGGSNQPVSVSSNPPGATFVVKASSGLQIAEAGLPQTIVLPRKNSQIDLTIPGYRTQTTVLTKGLNGWVFVNLLFWPGAIVDFVTGAASKLEPTYVQVSLQVAQAPTSGAATTFAVVRFLDKNSVLVGEQRLRLEPLSAGETK